MDCKEEYRMLKEMGDLTEQFPHLTGDWETDKEQFIEIYNQNEKLFKNEGDI